MTASIEVPVSQNLLYSYSLTNHVFQGRQQGSKLLGAFIFVGRFRGVQEEVCGQPAPRYE
ncbi:unnamed protein product [Prunus armeniaca]